MYVCGLSYGSNLRFKSPTDSLEDLQRVRPKIKRTMHENMFSESDTSNNILQIDTIKDGFNGFLPPPTPAFVLKCLALSCKISCPAPSPAKYLALRPKSPHKIFCVLTYTRQTSINISFHHLQRTMLFPALPDKQRSGRVRNDIVQASICRAETNTISTQSVATRAHHCA
jgi:hypothetical protein